MTDHHTPDTPPIPSTPSAPPAPSGVGPVDRPPTTATSAGDVPVADTPTDNAPAAGRTSAGDVPSGGTSPDPDPAVDTPNDDVAAGRTSTDDPVAGDAPTGGAPTRSHQWAALAGFGAIATATAVGGALVGPGRPSVMTWYRALRKPPFTPPSGLFGPVWSVLYALIAVSGWRVWRRPDSPERTRALALWGAQMATNAAWTPLFFGARRPTAALVDLGAQMAATAGYAAEAARVDRPAAALMSPYLGWTAFAGALNAEIARRNE